MERAGLKEFSFFVDVAKGCFQETRGFHLAVCVKEFYCKRGSRDPRHTPTTIVYTRSVRPSGQPSHPP